MSLFLWAHRGASARAPENTLAAFRAAEGAGADGIELDVHLSRDGVPVVIHDQTLDRTTDGRGPVSRFPLKELRRLDAGGWFAPEFAGEPLPSLEDVLAWAGERLRLNIEIKAEKAGMAVLRVLGAFPRARVLVSSFDRALLRKLRQVDSRLPLGVLADSPLWRRPLDFARACGAESFHPRYDIVSLPLVAACRSRGLAVYPWTVDGRELLGRLVRQGVDGVFANDPAALRRRSSLRSPAALQDLEM